MRDLAMLWAAALVLAGCEEETTDAPGAVTMSDEALGYFCQMDLSEHEGPRAQVHTDAFDFPIWFSQVRDAVAYTRLPEETADVLAVYVSDMGAAAGWDDPGADNWIAVDTAHFVIGSRRTGGMGAPEAIPFGGRADAEAFSTEYGGDVVAWSEIPDDYVLAPVDLLPASPEADR